MALANLRRTRVHGRACRDGPAETIYLNSTRNLDHRAKVIRAIVAQPAIPNTTVADVFGSFGSNDETAAIRAGCCAEALLRNVFYRGIRGVPHHLSP